MKRKLLVFLIFSLIAGNALAAADDYNRRAQGDLTEQGGARRLTADQTEFLIASLSNKTAKNVILLIGDGMGDSEITAARNYALGAGGYFEGIDVLPLTGQYTHYSLDKKTHKPNYVTDSAASATAWSSGVKSYNGALGVDVNGKDHQTLLEIAKAAGKATGNVTTSELQDATPAAQASHVTSRKCYGPTKTSELCACNALENGGRGSITEQLLTTRADVTLGGGAATFKEVAKAGKFQGQTLNEQAKALGYQIVTNASDLSSQSGQAAAGALRRREYAGTLARTEGDISRQPGPAASEM